MRAGQKFGKVFEILHARVARARRYPERPHSWDLKVGASAGEIKLGKKVQRAADDEETFSSASYTADAEAVAPRARRYIYTYIYTHGEEYLCAPSEPFFLSPDGRARGAALLFSDSKKYDNLCSAG